MSDIKHSPSRVGDISELDVCLRFMRDGWEVFRNVGSSGPVDFVVVNPKTGHVMLLDSKTPTIHKHKDGTVTVQAAKLTPQQLEMGVRVVSTYRDKVFIRKDRIKEKFENEDS